MAKIKESELVLAENNTVYHIRARQENIAENIILVGDPSRVPEISFYFDTIDFKMMNREICTHTGTYNNKRVSVISTGMGPDNIDIVMNEIDAIFNIDLDKREIKDEHTSLNIIRLGTSGALQADLDVDTFIMSEYGLGLDGMIHFYKDEKGIFEKEMTEAFIKHTSWASNLPTPYIVKASDKLVQKIGFDLPKGITATAPGFYGPQGRELRLKLAYPNINSNIETFRYNDKRITNLEMETSALYGLGTMLGHETLTVCVLVANRVTKKFSVDYKPAIKKLTEIVLNRITS